MEATEQEIRRPDPTDEQVIERVRAGDTAHFELLMRRHNQRVFRACRAILKDDAEAEDVMQEAYVRAYTHLAEFAGRAAFSTWLTRIAVHEAYARLRRQSRFVPLAASEAIEHASAAAGPTPPRDPERAASDRELAHLLEAALDALPEAFRTVLMLRAVEGMSGAEAAECLGIPEETVKTRLFRARALLRSDLEARTDPALEGVHRFYLERCDRVVAAVLRRLGVRAVPERRP
jgi:RNA polymerase sigma-70 factor (ECF subfamily)